MEYSTTGSTTFTRCVSFGRARFCGTVTVPQRIVTPPVGGGPKTELHGSSTNRGDSPADFEACAFATRPTSTTPASRTHAAPRVFFPHDIIHLSCVTPARQRRLVCQRPAPRCATSVPMHFVGIGR